MKSSGFWVARLKVRKALVRKLKGRRETPRDPEVFMIFFRRCVFSPDAPPRLAARRFAAVLRLLFLPIAISSLHSGGLASVPISIA